MSLYPKFRDVHLYVGLIVLLPIVAIAATGVMLNHEHALGLKFEKHKEKDHKERERGDKEETGRHEYAKDQKKTAAQRNEHKVKHEEKQQGDHHPLSPALKCKAGMWQTYEESIDLAIAGAMAGWGKEMPLEKVELKDEPGMGMVVKIKSAKGSGAMPDEFIYQVASGTMYEKAEEGGNWVKDLHTGKLFSHYWGFLFSDVTGLALVALSATGIVLYAIPLMKKRSKKKKKAPAARPGATPLPQVGGTALPAKPQSPDSQ